LVPFVDSIELPERPWVPIHTELYEAHIYLLDGRPTALIDFADARTGHPDYEWAALAEFVFQGEPGLLGACLAAYGEPPDRLGPERSRQLCAWSLLHRFASLPRALAAAGSPPPPDLDALSRRLFSCDRRDRDVGLPMEPSLCTPT
jgi:aminoglycoside phosphotransferase (APT) family kinase protein